MGGTVGGIGLPQWLEANIGIQQAGAWDAEALWSVRLSHVMKNRPTVNAGSIPCERHCYGLSRLVLLDADTVRTGGGVGGGRVREQKDAFAVIYSPALACHLSMNLRGSLWECPPLACTKEYKRPQAQLPFRPPSEAQPFPGSRLQPPEEEREVMLDN